MLYIIATPIGNLEDITLRAVRILKEVNLIAAEDTRTSKVLLKKYEINTHLTSFHSYTDERKLQELINHLKNGESLAMISDAGTPGISDPGFKLVNAARAAQIKVIPIPGPTAFLTALMASGMPINKFVYLGFLPLKKGRQTLLKSLVKEEKTMVFYESPHRILKTLGELSTYFGNRKIILARELTKIYEEFLSGTAAELLEIFKNKNPKGEFVVIIEAKDRKSN